MKMEKLGEEVEKELTRGGDVLNDHLWCHLEKALDRDLNEKLTTVFYTPWRRNLVEIANFIILEHAND